MGSKDKTGTKKVAAENLEEKRLDEKQKRDAATKSTKIV